MYRPIGEVLAKRYTEEQEAGRERQLGRGVGSKCCMWDRQLDHTGRARGSVSKVTGGKRALMGLGNPYGISLKFILYGLPTSPSKSGNRMRRTRMSGNGSNLGILRYHEGKGQGGGRLGRGHISFLQ